MRWWFALSLLLLSGCTGGADGPREAARDSVDGDAIAANAVLAPTWEAGQWWETSFQVKVRQTGAQGTNEFTDSGTWRAQVLMGEQDTPAGRAALVLHSQSTTLEPSREWLQAIQLQDFSNYYIDAWQTDSCDEAHLCLPPLAANLEASGDSELRFPIAAGTSWDTEQGHESPQSTYENRDHYEVLAWETVATPAGTFDALHIRVTGWMNTTHGADYWNFTQDVHQWYAPAVGQFVRMELQGNFAGLIDGNAETAHYEGVLQLSGHGHQALPALDEVVSRLELPTEPSRRPPVQPVRIQFPSPTRLMEGDSWTFEAILEGEAPQVEWRLARQVPGRQPVEETTGTGPSFTVEFPVVGAFVVEALVRDASGRETGRHQASILVDGVREGTGECKAAVAPVPLSAKDTCEGLLFDLPPGFYVIDAKATYSAEQSVLPCPALVLYRDGQESFRNYWWTAGGNVSPASASSASLSSNGTTWEIRWEPSSSAGGTVHYTADIQALGSGSLSGPGGNGC